MDVLIAQIKLYENLIQNYTEYLQCLKNNLAQHKTSDVIPDILASDVMPDILASDVMPDIEDTNQDMIWQRIRQAHLDDSNVENTQTSLGYVENNIENLELNMESNRDVKKVQVVSRLSKFTTFKQNQIIKNIFIKARENMKILAELDKNILDNMEENVNKEADRILEVYLNEGGDYEN